MINLKKAPAKPLYQHDCNLCTFLGTVDKQDLYYCGDGDRNATLIARYSSDGPDYMSGLVFSRDGILRIAAERAINKGLLTREDWRSKVYRNYMPYSKVKKHMLMSSEELKNIIFSDRNRVFEKSHDSKLTDLIHQILDKREKKGE